MADIQVDEGIEVVKLEDQEEQSYSILDFSDYLDIRHLGFLYIDLNPSLPDHLGS